MKIDLIVLGFLQHKPMYGYEIAGFFEKRGIDLWSKIKKPSVYKALNRLEEKQYIKGKFQMSENNPPRKVYHLTEKGKKYFLKLLDETLNTEEFINPIDFWNALRFVQGNITREKFITIIDKRIKNMEKKKKECEKKHLEAEKAGDLGKFPFYMKTMMQSFQKINQINKATLETLKIQAKLPENQTTFIKEEEHEN